MSTPTHYTETTVSIRVSIETQNGTATIRTSAYTQEKTLGNVSHGASLDSALDIAGLQIRQYLELFALEGMKR